MSTKKPLSQRVKYEDVSYYATSQKNKATAFYISRTADSVLRKLIHLESKNKAINYQNKTLSEFTHMTQRLIEDSINVLRAAKYINCYYHYVTIDGQIQKRRTIFINWKFIEEIHALIPPYNPQEDQVPANNIDESDTYNEPEQVQGEKAEPVVPAPDINTPVQPAKPPVNAKMIEILGIIKACAAKYEIEESDAICTNLAKDYQTRLSNGEDIATITIYKEVGDCFTNHAWA